MKAALTPQQLRTVFDRVVRGETISDISKELGVDRSALTQRLKRRFPEEYSKAASSGFISGRNSKATLDRKADEILRCPAVRDYLDGKGTLKAVSANYGISSVALHKRVKRYRSLTSTGQ